MSDMPGAKIKKEWENDLRSQTEKLPMPPTPLEEAHQRGHFYLKGDPAMALEDDVLEYIRVSKAETELAFKVFRGDDSDTWPKPSSTQLWFSGIEKYGAAFAEKEYELWQGFFGNN